ncbi:flagellar hook-basal body complex protein FliE [Nesterenkonia lutea]|uniref:Flagellar hook-basal body complex protein FliE n=1 Tax=Nesterenkonia lutea TaxID=272919 RepID=A0ABR9JFD8_9MICC|nr:flagellar hook-basal body complex protein FliE [Nesterenkonia lutea]MBE1524644.1 flagellar hook-basal body complex protein FliE [Nesterenkonia lutea]
MIEGIAPAAGVAAVSGTGYVPAAASPGLSGQPQRVEGPQGDFAATLGGAMDEVQSMQSTSRELGVKALTGDLTDMHEATLASSRASVALELVATVRNRGVEAFNEIMRMQA